MDCHFGTKELGLILRKLCLSNWENFQKCFFFFLFLVYVEMIGTVFAKIKETSTDGQGKELFKSAIEAILIIQSRNRDPKFRLTPRDLNECEIDTAGDDILKDTGTNLDILLWMCLKIWMDKSGTRRAQFSNLHWVSKPSWPETRHPDLMPQQSDRQG
jgi:hypothetical protein